MDDPQLDTASSELAEYLTSPHKSRGRRRVGPASFAAKMDERIRWRRYLLRRTDITPVSQPLVKKVQRDRIMAHMGLPVPEKFVDNGSITDVLVDVSMRDRVVIKPVAGASSSGVMLLRREGRAWRDLRRDIQVTEADIKASMEAVRHRAKPVERWFTERLVEGRGNKAGHPMDYKFYMFQQSCGLILAKRHHEYGHSFRWFANDWREVKTGKYSKLIDDKIARPGNSDLLLRVAREISMQIPLPFVRVDLIEGDGQVFLSELSPLPGQYDRFSPVADEFLGFLWESAEVEHCLDFQSLSHFARCREALRAVSGAEKLWPA